MNDTLEINGMKISGIKDVQDVLSALATINAELENLSSTFEDNYIKYDKINQDSIQNYQKQSDIIQAITTLQSKSKNIYDEVIKGQKEASKIFKRERETLLSASNQFSEEHKIIGDRISNDLTDTLDTLRVELNQIRGKISNSFHRAIQEDINIDTTELAKKINARVDEIDIENLNSNVIEVKDTIKKATNNISSWSETIEKDIEQMNIEYERKKDLFQQNKEAQKNLIDSFTPNRITGLLILFFMVSYSLGQFITKYTQSDPLETTVKIINHLHQTKPNFINKQELINKIMSYSNDFHHKEWTEVLKDNTGIMFFMIMALLLSTFALGHYIYDLNVKRKRGYYD